MNSAKLQVNTKNWIHHLVLIGGILAMLLSYPIYFITSLTIAKPDASPEFLIIGSAIIWMIMTLSVELEISNSKNKKMLRLLHPIYATIFITPVFLILEIFG